MPMPQVTSVEFSTGDVVPLSLDFETGTPIEITLYGSNLGGVSDIELDSGPDVQWMVTGVSASSNSIVVTGYATGYPGPGSVVFRRGSNTLFSHEVAEFAFPILD